jgi:hypothetical protein
MVRSVPIRNRAIQASPWFALFKKTPFFVGLLISSEQLGMPIFEYSKFGIPDSFVRASCLRTFRLQFKAARFITNHKHHQSGVNRHWLAVHCAP